jgi:hypothetical protein
MNGPRPAPACYGVVVVGRRATDGRFGERRHSQQPCRGFSGSPTMTTAGVCDAFV